MTLSIEKQMALHQELERIQHDYGVSVLARVCDTCGYVLRPTCKDGQGVAGVSHGRCPECRDKSIYSAVAALTGRTYSHA